jgi:hypothetical protein
MLAGEAFAPLQSAGPAIASQLLRKLISQVILRCLLVLPLAAFFSAGMRLL